MTELPRCAQPSDDDSNQPCGDTTIAGTDRCLRHAEPGTGGNSYSGRYQGTYPAPTEFAEPVPIPARPYTDDDFTSAANDIVIRANLAIDAGNLDRAMQGRPPLPLFPPVDAAVRRSFEQLAEVVRTPPPAELLAIADDLNGHGGLDEKFVAELIRQAVTDEPLDAAYTALGVPRPIVEPAPPLTTSEPITYESIIEALETIAPLGPTRLDVVKLTQEQIDAVTASQPHAAPTAEPWHFFGTPVELVETVEESTPYRLWLEQAEAEHGMKAVAELPGGAILGNPACLVSFTPFAGEPSVAERLVLNDWLRWYDSRPTRIEPFGEPFRPLADVLDEQPPAERRPWWRRALDRVRRWAR